MERQKKVIDASIAVKWFIKEEGRKATINLRDMHIREEIVLVAPELIILEILNSLRYKNNDKEKLKEINENLIKIQIEIVPLNKFLMEKAIAAAVEYNLTIYDALYVAIAQINGIELITEDEKLLKVPNSKRLTTEKN